MVCAAIVVARILNELEAREPGLLEGHMIGGAGVALSDRGHSEVFYRLHPLREDGRDALIPLGINTQQLARAIVHVVVGVELCGFRLEGRRHGHSSQKQRHFLILLRTRIAPHASIDLRAWIPWCSVQALVTPS